MLDSTAAFETNAGFSDLPPIRDRLPTIPHDLCEYALAQTGPSSWSAHRDSVHVPAWSPDVHDDPLRAMTTGLLVDVWPTDVPSAATTPDEAARVIDHREAFVFSLIDGKSSLGSMLDGVDLPSAELLAIVCDLCARGLVTLDRSQRTLLQTD